MSDVSKLQINNETYNIKDAQARTNINEINEDINLINSEKTIIIGDSYALGSNPNNENLTSWAEILKNLMELNNSNCSIFAEAGSGFLRAGTYNHTFLQLLQSQINNIANKNKVKNIIICGGYNDNTYSANDIKEAISEFVNYSISNFPNAQIYIGLIGYRREISNDATTTRANLASQVYPAYANNIAPNLNKYIYLNGVENILKSNPTSYMYENNSHPNQNGQNALGQGIFQAFKTGEISSYSNNTITITNDNATDITSYINSKKNNNIYQITVEFLTVKFSQGSSISITNNSLFELGEYQVNNFIGGINKDFNIAQCTVSIQDYEKGRFVLPAYILFDTDGKLKLWIWANNGNGQSVTLNSIKQIDIFKCKCIMPILLS